LSELGTGKALVNALTPSPLTQVLPKFNLVGWQLGKALATALTPSLPI